MRYLVGWSALALWYLVPPLLPWRNGAAWDVPGEASSRPLSVCEAIARRQELADKVVAVRGVVLRSMEGEWLAPEKACDDQLITKGYKWDMWIWVDAWASSYSERHVDFAFDRHASDAVEREIRRRTRGAKDATIVLTYTGLLYTYRDLSEHVIVYPGGHVRGFGFGHGGAAPVGLLVKTVSAPEVRGVSR